MTLPQKVVDVPGKVEGTAHIVDRIFFFLGAAAALWLAWAIFDASLGWSWDNLVLLICFWLVLAYLLLPRLNRILSSIYVPGYFIGRTRTSDGLLGDPLNLAARGSAEQLDTAMTHAGWIKADPVDARSSLRIVTATITKRSYPEAPVSPLFLFDRQQDVAYQQEVEGNPGQRHHVRFWRTPEDWPLPGGTRVDWLGGATYDRRVGFSLFTLQITHKIDADIDIERDHVVATVTDAVPGTAVEVLKDFTTSYHSRNGGGDRIRTDGSLPILELESVASAADASDLRTGPPRGIPAQVLLPVLGALWAAIAFVVDAINAGALVGDSTGSVAVARSVYLALGVIGGLLAIGVLLRSALARWALLGVALVTVIARVLDYHLQLGHDKTATLVQAEVAILFLIGLSSSAADTWTRKMA